LAVRLLKGNPSRGLAFFATPHAGGNSSLVTLGSVCANIINCVSGSLPNDIMDAVTAGSVYADTLEENWKHQLNDYRILSFYEGIGNVSSIETKT
jgi:hypothetical protein